MSCIPGASLETEVQKLEVLASFLRQRQRWRGVVGDLDRYICEQVYDKYICHCLLCFHRKVPAAGCPGNNFITERFCWKEASKAAWVSEAPDIGDIGPSGPPAIITDLNRC